MTEQLSVRLDNTNKLIVSGHLDFKKVPLLFEQSLPLMANLNNLWIDFSDTDSVSSSAALALLVEWIKYAKKTGKSLKLTRLPEQLNLLIKIAGLQELIEKYR